VIWSNIFSLEELGQFIQQERRRRGWKQQDFAQELAVARSTVSGLENGSAVSAQLLFRALSLLGLRLVVAPRAAQVSVQCDPQEQP
jgi:transcriptional regulator with XRE-family HTH domain